MSGCTGPAPTPRLADQLCTNGIALHIDRRVPEMVRAACGPADGAIVGSAVIHRITDAKGQPREQIISEVGQFIEQLLEPIRSP